MEKTRYAQKKMFSFNPKMAWYVYNQDFKLILSYLAYFMTKRTKVSS